MDDLWDDSPKKTAAGSEMYDVSICTDCLMMAANGEGPDTPDQGNPPGWEPLDQVDDGFIVVPSDDEGSFSWSGCDTCSSRLGGTKFDATLMSIASKTAAVNVHGVKVGDIFYSSWGYDQTNIDYYLVVRTTAKAAEVKPINGKVVDTHRTSYDVVPDPDSYRAFDVRLETGSSSPYGKPERSTKLCKVTNGYRGEPTIILNSRDHAYAYPWRGEALNETDSRFGH